jgi:hypothetical protein
MNLEVFQSCYSRGIKSKVSRRAASIALIFDIEVRILNREYRLDLGQQRVALVEKIV